MKQISDPMTEKKHLSNIQGLENYSREEIKGFVREGIHEMLIDANVIDVDIKGIEIIGSRNRGDAKKRSDLDIVVEYSGDEREDDMFCALNDRRMRIEGIRVDINPIKAEKSGTLKEYMKESNRYDAEKLKEDAAKKVKKASGRRKSSVGQ
jgi:predicted nucleotidyltransferase